MVKFWRLIFFRLHYREKIIAVLIKSMKNPRSALIKTSIMASSDIFNSFGDRLLDASTSNAFDQLVRACN